MMEQTKSKVRLDLFDSSEGLVRGATKTKELIWYIIKMIFFLTAFPYPNSVKCRILRAFGAKVGKGVVIKPRVNIHFPWKLVIGDYVWIGEEAFLLNFEQLFIGNNVCVSQRAFICGGNHNFTDPKMAYKNGPIELRDGCWVGASCFISPGVIIGEDAIVTAGSVVSSGLEPGGIYKGNPLVYVKKRWK